MSAIAIVDPPGRVPRDTTAGEWLRPKEAASRLGYSRTTMLRKADAGEYPSRRDGRGRQILVTQAAARELVKERRRRDDDAVAAEVGPMLARGLDAVTICAELGVHPKVVAGVVEALGALETQVRARETERRMREAATGHPHHPTTWAWVAARPFVTYAQAKVTLDLWLTDGGDPADVSPLVYRAVASPAAWAGAVTQWRAEVAAAAAAKDAAEKAAQAALEERMAPLAAKLTIHGDRMSAQLAKSNKAGG